MTISPQHLQGSLLVLISSVACVIGASIVFIDKIWPKVSILENQSFLAASMALASGVLLYSSLAVLLPEAVERLDDSYLVYVGFFGGAAFTLILTRIIHWCTPGAVHACGGSPSMNQQRDEESGHCSSSSSSSTTSNHDDEDGHTSAGSRTLAYTERHSIKHHPISAQGSTQYGTTTTTTTTTTKAVAPFSEAHFRIHSMTTGGQQQSHHHHHHHHDNDNHHHEDDHSSEDSSSFLRIGIQTAVAIGVHKFPEGLIMFVSNQASSSLGWSIAAAMSIHNLTEGFMIALPLYFALRSRTAAFGWAALLGGLSQPLGALIGYFLLQSIDKSQENLMFGIVLLPTDTTVMHHHQQQQPSYHHQTYLSHAVMPEWDLGTILNKASMMTAPGTDLFYHYPLLAPALMSIVLGHTMTMTTQDLVRHAKLLPPAPSSSVTDTNISDMWFGPHFNTRSHKKMASGEELRSIWEAQQLRREMSLDFWNEEEEETTPVNRNGLPENCPLNWLQKQFCRFIYAQIIARYPQLQEPCQTYLPICDQFAREIEA